MESDTNSVAALQALNALFIHHNRPKQRKGNTVYINHFLSSHSKSHTWILSLK